MYCAVPLTLKVCSSVTTAVTAAATSCGTYKFINVVVLQANTVCSSSEMQLTTASESNLLDSIFNLDIATVEAILPSILALLATAWVIKQVIQMLKNGS